jgi:hypothetical protein
MPALTDARLQNFIDHAQLSLHSHELYRKSRDPSYQEILSFVEEMVDLLLELRRERAALEEIAHTWGECLERREMGDPSAEMAMHMCMKARLALGMPLDEAGSVPRAPV